jgi:iron complex outermembrane recepter protein
MAHLAEIRRAVLAASVLAAAGLASGMASGQEAASALEEIVITGTRISNPNATSSSPILAVSSENIRLQGIVDAGDLVDQLPQNITTVVDLSNTSNPLSTPGGVTTMNLRGLGPQRTLVLVDGRRLGVGDPNSGNPNPAPDINQIPSALIERVDIVTGGASAVYGSDAIAGVANFVMRRDFEGVQLDAQYGFNWHENGNDRMQDLVNEGGLPLPKSNVTDGDELAVSLVVGGNFADGRGNATGYLSYIDSNPVTLAQRDYSSCQLVGDGTECGGSPNSNYFQVIDPDVTPVGGTPDGEFAVLGSELVEWGTAGTSPPALFNSNPYMNLKHGRNRYQGGVFAKYDWSERATLYTDFMFMKDDAETAVAPSGLFIGSPISVFCNNSLMSDQQRTAIGCTPAMIAAGDSVDLLIGRRNIEGGPRQFKYEHTNYRAMAGVRGDLNEAWSYDAYGSYYDTDLLNRNDGYISIQRTRLGLNGCQQSADPADLAAGCVPYNIWQDGGVTRAATDYLFAYGLAQGQSTQAIGSASMTGDLGSYGARLPTAEDGVGVAFGAEYRRDTFGFLPDQTLGSGDLSGSGGASPTIDADTDVTEMFVEFRVPLVQGKTGAQDLAFETGYRYSDYELSGGVDTYKFGLQWEPIETIRLRGSFNHAIRAPSLIELFNPQAVTNTSVFSVDPCAGANPTMSQEECARTGVTAAQYGNITQCPAAQCSVLTGGNPLVEPEVADTITVGFTLQPTALPELAVSVDWYEIEVEDIIGNIPLNSIFNGCASGSNPEYCDQVVRTPFGTLFGDTIGGGGYIVGTNANVAKATFQGVDAQGSYRFDIGRLGSLVASLNAVYIIDTKTLPVEGALEFDCAGLYGNQCGPATPDWRHSLRLSWQFLDNIEASLQWRYIDSVTHEQNTSQPALQVRDENGDLVRVDFGGELASRSYFDLAANWNVTDQYSLRLGINNLLDQDPPLVDTVWSGPGTPNTWGPYDTLGRQIFFALTGKF